MPNQGRQMAALFLCGWDHVVCASPQLEMQASITYILTHVTGADCKEALDRIGKLFN